MEQIGWDRRDVVWGLSAIAGAAILGASARSATAQEVRYSSGTEHPMLKVPANACDCHHHIYGCVGRRILARELDSGPARHRATSQISRRGDDDSPCDPPKGVADDILARQVRCGA